MADERAPGVEYVEVDVAVLGAGETGPAYGLRGDKILGWGHASADYAGVSGWIPPGETVELVTTDPYTDMSSVLPVDAGGATIQLTTTPTGLFALIDLRSESPAIHVYGSRMELHQHVGEELLPSGYLVEGALIAAPECRLNVGCDPGDALLTGVIRYDQSCSFVEAQSEGGQDPGAEGMTFALLWMHGAIWDESQSAVRLSSDVVVRNGDVVDVGGGGGGTLENLEHWYPDDEVPGQLRECGSRPGVDGWWIGNAIPRSD